MSRRRDFLTALATVAVTPSLVTPSLVRAQSLSPLLPEMLEGSGTGFYGVNSRIGLRGRSASPPSRIQLPGGNTRIYVWVPDGVTSAKTVIFSHGELGSPDVYSDMVRHWTSHGFAVMAPIHQDSLLQNSVQSQARTRDRGVRMVLEDSDSWAARIEGIRLTLDAVPWLRSQTGIAFDAETPIVVGHSFGAFSAAVLMGAQAVLADGSTFRRPDERFFGAVLLSPQGRGALGLTDSSWTNMRGPTLCVTGPGDVDATGQSAQVKAEPHFLSPAGYRHLAWFSGVEPNWFAGTYRAGSLAANGVLDIRAVTTAFLRAYGDYNEEVLRAMTSPIFGIQMGGRVALSNR